MVVDLPARSLRTPIWLDLPPLLVSSVGAVLGWRELFPSCQAGFHSYCWSCHGCGFGSVHCAADMSSSSGLTSPPLVLQSTPVPGNGGLPLLHPQPLLHAQPQQHSQPSATPTSQPVPLFLGTSGEPFMPSAASTTSGSASSAINGVGNDGTASSLAANSSLSLDPQSGKNTTTSNSQPVCVLVDLEHIHIHSPLSSPYVTLSFSHAHSFSVSLSLSLCVYPRVSPFL